MIMIMNNFIPSVLGVLLFLTGIFTTSPSLNLPVENTGNDHNRVKRSRPCQDKFKIIPDHTACLDRSSKVQESGLQGNEADVIVDQHNKVRTEVSAMNMLKMSWDEDVAFIAQRWAENCQIDHDPNYNRYNYGRFSVGQNLAWGNFKMTWSQAIKLWADEKAYYTYGSRSGAGGKAIGHYTQDWTARCQDNMTGWDISYMSAALCPVQARSIHCHPMVWAESAKIGCGYANCAGTHYYVCNYAPAGNLDPAFPYKRGLRCADCPSKCSNGLCDCGNKVCLNGGKMDLDKCTCTCIEGLPFYFQPSCSLNCTEIHDPNWCSQYGKSGCSKYTNVPQECPNMCNWCPAAGATYDGKTSSASYATSVLITVLLSVLSVFSI